MIRPTPERSISKKLLHIGTLSLLVLIAICGQTGAADFAVDPAQSELVVRLSKAGFAAVLAHDHAIHATGCTGTVRTNPGGTVMPLLKVEVQTDSLVADEPDLREKYGLPESVSDSARRQIQSTMLSATQMDAERFPTMKFQSTRIENQSEGRFLITGDLTIHGIKKSITFPAAVEKIGSGSLRGKAEIEFRQSDFGIKPYSAMFGAVRNRDEAILYIDLVVTPHQADKGGD